MLPFRRYGLALGLLAVLMLPAAPGAQAQNEPPFFTTDGTQILGPSGDPVLLRGFGLGGWLMPEGYMLHIPGFGSPTSIRTQIEALIGKAGTDAFFEMYRANYVEEKDIAAIASWGVNHVRLPFHYAILYNPETEAFREDGFTLLDTFLDWCRTHGLYVILDMHAAPGGQNDGNISDSDGTARLWIGPTAAANQDRIVAIWTEIARRYADEPLIIGYDLLNEPVLPDGVPGSALRALYERLTEAIRAVDPNHILFIEGNWYATDFSALVPPFDDNMVYAFHKYWNGTDRQTIQYLLDLREQYQVPLWLGETGENSNDWFYEVVQMVEDEGIGWNWWTHKKIATVTSPRSAPMTPDYRRVLDYWNGTAAKPRAAEAEAALLGQAAMLDLDSCDTRPGVLAALLDPAFHTTAVPFRDHTLPGAIDAVDYDLGGQGVAYSDRDYKNESGSPGIANTGGAYRNDGVDIEPSSDAQGAAYNVGWIASREWLTYTAEVTEAGRYDVQFRVASLEGGGAIDLLVNGERVAENILVPRTGGWQNWRIVSAHDVPLPAGTVEIRLVFGPGDFNLNRMTFERVAGTHLDDRPESPRGMRLVGVYPQPFRDNVRLRLESEEPVDATVTLIDVLGREVVRWPVTDIGAGQHDMPLTMPSLAAGWYTVRIAVRFPAGGEQVLHAPLVRQP